MSRGTNQKFKFTYLMKIMLAKTDDEHALTLSQIMEELEKYNVTAERKSIYTDFQDMTEKFGVEIIKEQMGSWKVEFQNSRISIRSIRNFFKRRRMPMLNTE